GLSFRKGHDIISDQAEAATDYLKTEQCDYRELCPPVDPANRCGFRNRLASRLHLGRLGCGKPQRHYCSEKEVTVVIQRTAVNKDREQHQNCRRRQIQAQRKRGPTLERREQHNADDRQHPREQGSLVRSIDKKIRPPDVTRLFHSRDRYIAAPDGRDCDQWSLQPAELFGASRARESRSDERVVRCWPHLHGGEQDGDCTDEHRKRNPAYLLESCGASRRK